MTVFACLLFLAMISLVFLCLDGCLIYQAETRCSMAQTGLAEHLLANYSIPLAKRYRLYFLDPRMGEKEMEKRGQKYYEELFGGSTGAAGHTSRLLNFKTESVEAVPFGTMQEKECQYLIAQIKDCMQYDLTKEIIFETLETAAQETKEQKNQIEDMMQDLDGKQREVEENSSHFAENNTLISSETTEEESKNTIAGKSSPMQQIRNILKYGIIGAVTDESSISEQKIASSLLPFPDQTENKIHISMDMFQDLSRIKEWIEQETLADWTEHMTEKGAVSLYMRRYFNYYGREDQLEDTQLLYEAEYLLGGQYTDKENLEYVIHRMILMRFAFNSLYGFTGQELREQALSAAALLAGATGSPELVEAVRYLILAAVTFLESVTDVKALLHGERVPLLKTKSTWQTAVSGQTTENRPGSESGLDYADYLLILLMTKTDTRQQCLRMQNLIQLNIQQEEPEFQIRQCYAGIRLKSRVQFQGRFHADRYLFENEEKYQY